MASGVLALAPDLIASIVKRADYDDWHSCALTCRYLSQCLRGLFDNDPAALFGACRMVRRWQKWLMPVLSILDLGTLASSTVRRITTTSGYVFPESVFTRSDNSEVTWNTRDEAEAFCRALFECIDHEVVFADLIGPGHFASPYVTLDMGRLSAMQAFATMVEEDTLQAMRRAVRAREFRASAEEVRRGGLAVDARDLEFAIETLHMSDRDDHDGAQEVRATKREGGKIHLMNLGYMHAGVNPKWIRGSSGFVQGRNAPYWGAYNIHPLPYDLELSVVCALAHRAGIPRFTGDFTRLAWEYFVARAVSLLARTLVVMAGAVVPDDESESDESDDESESESDVDESDDLEAVAMSQIDPLQSADANMANALLEAEFHSEVATPPHRRDEYGFVFAPTERALRYAVAGLRCKQ